MGDLPTGTVTFLFTDLESSTRLWEQQPQEMQTALARHDELLVQAVETHGGQVIKGTGDGLHAVFSTADAGVVAAVAAQRGLAAQEWGPLGSLRVRMGLHTGVAEQRGGDYFGPVLNRAARLMGVAHPGQTLCSQATADLVRDALPPPVGLIELGGYRLPDLERPEVLFQVTHPELPTGFPPLHTGGAPAGNLPRQVTSFVGHEDDLSAIAAELASTPIVTLTGVGGVGKTRLALEAASRLAPGYRDGAWLCELAAVRDVDMVQDAVLEIFGVEPQRGTTSKEALLQFLRTKELLLVVDNCEHLLRPAARLAGEIMRTCPGVRMLVTSREGLGLAGEHIRVVPSLDAPEDSDDLDAVSASEAVRLFLARAQAVRAEFALEHDNAASVAQICRRLDGVPLAIELAAARVAMLTPAELARRLDQRFRVLTGSEHGVVERHQTLRAAIDWSYDLLDDAERRLLDRLSVFAGGFTLEAAEAVTTGEGIDPSQLFDLLASLVARSLVEADTHGRATRYRLLETIRQYAEERLGSTKELGRVRDEHAGFYTAFVEVVTANLATAAEQEWLETSTREIDNLRAALAWLIETEDADAVLRLIGFAQSSAPFSDLRRLVHATADSALRIPGIADDPRYPAVVACAAMHAAWRGDLENMRRLADEAAAAERRLGVDQSVSVLGARTWATMVEGHIDEYLEHSEQLAAIHRARGDEVHLASSLAQIAMARALKGEDTARAVAEIEEALTLARAANVPSVMAVVQTFAAFVLADVDPERARDLMRDVLRDPRALVEGGGLSTALGDVAERLGEPRLALELFGRGMDELHWLGYSELAGRALRRIGLLLVDRDAETAAVLVGAGTARSRAATLTERVREQHRRAVEALDAALGADRCRELQSTGAAMEEHDAVALARTAVAQVLSDDLAPEPGSTPAEPSAAERNVFRREGDVWTVGYDGRTVRLRDAKGLRYLARLLAQPGREVHVSDLAADGVTPASGSGGEVLDEAAKRAYQRRLVDLEAERAEAAAWNDAERAARAEAEIDAVTEQLAGAYGLGGRSRTLADPVERIRKAVTNRIRDSLDRIAAEHEVLGRHLANAVHTGTFCSYTPERPTAWEL